MSIKIRPYKQGSKSAKALATKLGTKCLKLQGSSWIPQNGDIVINWGNTEAFGLPVSLLINPPAVIKQASNKKTFFEAMVGTPGGQHIPPFWVNKNDIHASAFENGIVCRTVLAGHSGEGIVIAHSPDALVPAPLYVGYIKKKDEYRIHLGRKPDGTSIIIMQQRKARRTDVPDSMVNWKIRNHSNGFIYQRQNVNPPVQVVEAARLCFESTGLHFGAVDVIWNNQQGKAYVLEINTAPGLEGSSVDDYATFFKEYLT